MVGEIVGGLIADLEQRRQTQSCGSLRNVGLLWTMSLDLVEQIGCTFSIRSDLICLVFGIFCSLLKGYLCELEELESLF
jgi:hypothetical protein